MTIIRQKISVIVILILLINILSFVTVASDNTYLDEKDESLNEKKIINEYTWSVMKYCDWLENTVNSETIYVPSPTQGPLLTLTDFMQPELCKVALEVYCENEDGTLNETQTLINLAKYVNDSMCFILGINEGDSVSPNAMDIWDSPSIERKTGKKVSAQEMALIGDHFLDEKYDFIGDCGSTSAFITAVLRLCGFPPEKVFEVNIGSNHLALLNKFPFIVKQGVGHFLNLINADDKWYVLDGTMWKNKSNGRLYTENEKYQIGKLLLIKDLDFYNMTEKNRFFIRDKVSLFENDKYFLGYSFSLESNYNIYSNLNKNDFKTLLTDGIKRGFNNAKFEGFPYLFPRLLVRILSNKVIPHPHMNSIALPYTVKDAIGDTNEGKAKYLANLNREFIDIHKNVNGILNQYDKAFYAYGYINVTYPQAYANAARLAGHASWFGYTNDTDTPFEDANFTISWIRENINDKKLLNQDQVAFADLTYILKNGSSLDQAILAYGILRNMKKDNDFWSKDELYIIITNETDGYLAVNITGDQWFYLNFNEDEPFKCNVENVRYAFNEEIKLDKWQQ